MWLQALLFWITECLVEYGFASLPWDACEGNSHLWPALTIIQCGCQIFPLPSCSEHFSFHIRVKKSSKGSVFAAHPKWLNSNSIKRQERPGAPGLAVSHALPPRHLAHKKKEERSFWCNLQACQKWEGRGKGKGIVLRNRKSFKAAAAVTWSSLRFCVLLFKLIWAFDSWKELICSCFNSHFFSILNPLFN